jgi:DNA-binding HxlR family transcriptional regulator
MILPKAREEQDFRANLEVIRHFRPHLQLLGDESVLGLLATFDSESFSNSEVRPLLGVKRKATWARLRRLVRSGLIEKRGHSYKASPSAHSLLSALAVALRGVITGEPPRPSPALMEVIVKVGPDAIEWAYAKGKMDRPEYLRCKKELVELETQMERKVALQSG